MEIADGAIDFMERSASRQESRSTPTCHTRWCTIRHCRRQNSKASRATGIGPTAWLRWITTWVDCSTALSDWDCATTPSWCSRVTTGPTHRRCTNAVRLVHGRAPCSRRWRVRTGCPSSSAGPVVSAQIARPMRSCTKSTPSPRCCGSLGADIPQDRPIDGVDQRDLLQGDTGSSAREGFPIFFGEKLYAANWRNFKLHFVWQTNATDPVLPLGIPAVFNLLTNPRENPDENLVDDPRVGDNGRVEDAR